MSVLQDSDQASLLTDPSITIQSPDGRQLTVVPFKLGRQSLMPRRDIQGRPFPHPHQQQDIAPQTVSLPPLPGASISIPAQVKKIAHSLVSPPPRISSNGGMRPPGLAVTGLRTTATLPQTSPTTNLTPVVNGINGMHHGGIVPVGRDTVKVENTTTSMPNGTGGQTQAEVHATPDTSAIPQQPRSQNQHPITLPNGYHLTTINGYPTLSNGLQFLPASGHGLSIQQKQSIKSAFATLPSADLPTNGTRQVPYMGHAVPKSANFNMPLMPGTGMNITLPPVRQMQWSSPAIPRASNGIDASVINTSPSPQPALVQDCVLPLFIRSDKLADIRTPFPLPHTTTAQRRCHPLFRRSRTHYHHVCHSHRCTPRYSCSTIPTRPP